MMMKRPLDCSFFLKNVPLFPLDLPPLPPYTPNQLGENEKLLGLYAV